MTIELTKLSDNYHIATIADSPEFRACGGTVKEAVGALILTYPDFFAIKIDDKRKAAK